MRKSMNTLPARQRGSFYTMAIMLVLLGAALTCALKIAPLYADHGVVSNAMEAMAGTNEFKTMPITEIRQELAKTLLVNRVEGLPADSIVVAREDGREYVDVEYEARVPIFGNISAVVAFKDRYNKF